MLILYAWVGEDEKGSGEVGLKQAITPAGCIPLVSTDREKITKHVMNQLQLQADTYGKTIRLIACREAETVMELKPRPQG